MTRFLLLAAIALPLTGCEVGPDFTHPAPPSVTGYAKEGQKAATASAQVQGGDAQHFVQGMDIPGQWWTLFHSQPLNDLVEQAMRHNLDLDAARAALLEAHENVYAQQGTLFPTVSANGQAARQRISGAAFGQPNLNPEFNLVTTTLNISYGLDVFGGARRKIEQLEAQAEYQRYQLEAAYLTLTSNVVVAAIQEASLRGQIAATRDIVKLEGDQLGVLRQQLNLGGVARSDVLTQQATLSAAQATLPPLEKQLKQTRDQLTALAGRFPSEEIEARFDLNHLTLPVEIPVSLPSRLVAQRPDVAAADATLHAASANIGVATANELPQFTITGQAGSTALGFASLFSPGTSVWNLGGSIAQTLIDGGTLLHRRRAAVADFDQAAAQYRSTVIKAFQNVADTLAALQSDADALHAQATAERSAADSLTLARGQFGLGGITYLTLLDAQRTYQQARINLVQAQANRYADTAALLQALGGGWWNRQDMTPGTEGSPDRLWISAHAQTAH